MKNIIILLLLIPIILFSQNDTINIYFTKDRDFQLETKLINKANEIFNKFSIIFIKTDKIYSNNLIKVELYNQEYFTEIDEDGNEIRFVGEHSGYIILATKKYYLDQIFIHEIGHNFGWTHSPSTKYVMHYKFVSYPIILSPENIEWFSSYNRKFYFNPKHIIKETKKNWNYTKDIDIIYK